MHFSNTLGTSDFPCKLFHKTLKSGIFPASNGSFPVFPSQNPPPEQILYPLSASGYPHTDTSPDKRCKGSPQILPKPGSLSVLSLLKYIPAAAAPGRCPDSTPGHAPDAVRSETMHQPHPHCIKNPTTVLPAYIESLSDTASFANWRRPSSAPGHKGHKC